VRQSSEQTSKLQQNDSFMPFVSRQFGAFTRSQATAHGMTDEVICTRVRRGEWIRVCRGIYRVAAVPQTWHQKVCVACLKGGPSAFASHLCSAAAWRLEGFAPGPVEVSTTARIVPLEGTRVHHVVQPVPGDVEQWGAVKVSSVVRTLIELAATVEDESLEIAMDDALRKRLTSVRRIEWRLDQIGARGMSGASRLRRVLGERDPNVRPESVLERRFLRLLVSHGFPAPTTQFSIYDAEGLVGRVDFAYPEQRVAIEADGYGIHSGKVQWEKDHARRNRLQALRWQVLNTTWHQIRTRPGDILGPLQTLLVEVSPGGEGR
jgi:hypothetical protein